MSPSSISDKLNQTKMERLFTKFTFLESIMNVNKTDNVLDTLQLERIYKYFARLNSYYLHTVGAEKAPVLPTAISKCFLIYAHRNGVAEIGFIRASS